MNFALAILLAASLPGLPKSGAKLESFVPAGWAIEQQLEGGLVTATSKDHVLVLLQAEKNEGDRARALVVLKEEPSGYSLLGSNLGLLACFNCAGMKGGEGAPELSIEKRVLVVRQYGGSREAYGSVHRFRVEKDGLRLIGMDHSHGDSLTGESSSVSENLLTGRVVEETVGPMPEGGGPEPKPVKKSSKVTPKPLLKLEDVKEDVG